VVIIIAESAIFRMTRGTAFTGQIVRFDQDACWDWHPLSPAGFRSGHSEILMSQQLNNCPDVRAPHLKPTCGCTPKIVKRQLQYSVTRTILSSSPDSHNPGASIGCQ
jgi:hypothetical protein